MADPASFSSSAYLAQAMAAKPASAPDISGVRTEAQAAKVAGEFEAFFLGQIMQGLFAGLDDGGAFGGGPGEKAFSGLLHEEYAKVFAKAGGIGLAGPLKAEIIRLQGLENNDNKESS